MNDQQILQIARVCHEANRAYCESIGDHTQVAWSDAADWQQASAIDGVNYHLGRIVAGVAADPAASHNRWMEHKIQDGWEYGPVKDAAIKQHPCMLPFHTMLPAEQRLKDYLFAAIVQSFCSEEVDRLHFGEGEHRA